MEFISFKHFVEHKLGKFAYFFIYAILEWIIIALLFLDGFITFFCNEFAKFFELQLPCLLCTRIDHIILHRGYDIYYNKYICEGHKKDISSLAYCHVHKKLTKIHTMCEACLVSFAVEKEFDCDTHKSLNKDNDSCGGDDLKYAKKCDSNEKNNVFRCSCCGEPLKSRSTLQKIIQNSSVTNLSSLGQVPKSSTRALPITWSVDELVQNVELPKLRYSKQNFMSDNESDVQDHDEHSSDAENQQNGEDTKVTTMSSLSDPYDIEDSSKTPTLSKGNKSFGFSLTDMALGSPKWANRLNKKKELEKMDIFAESDDLDTSDNETLKSLLRSERKYLISLFMELDEERSAAAIAANNAMAMITRLQAEKASVQMEALQYQRMMEEQAEYDEEAIQVMKDMLIKRDDEIKYLEADIDVYRERFGELEQIELDECFDEDHPRSESDKSGRNIKVSLDFESERLYLLDKLANLEEQNSAENEEGHEDDNDDIKKEISEIWERLKTIENDSKFLSQAAITLHKDYEGRKLLNEIAHHIRNEHSDKIVA